MESKVENINCKVQHLMLPIHTPTLGSNKIFDLLIPWPASFEHLVAGVQDPEAKPKTNNNLLPKGHVFFASNCTLPT